MEELNKLELKILERLSEEYPLVRYHIPYLKVESREITGVGMYSNFAYCNQGEKIPDLGINNASISTNETIEIEALKYGLAYEVDVLDGKLKFIELVTYGENWNGKIPSTFRFSK